MTKLQSEEIIIFESCGPLLCKPLLHVVSGISNDMLTAKISIFQEERFTLLDSIFRAGN